MESGIFESLQNGPEKVRQHFPSPDQSEPFMEALMANRQDSTTEPNPIPGAKFIPLTQGKFAIVDEHDYEWLMQWKWRYNPGKAGCTGYAGRNSKPNIFEPHSRDGAVLMHREIVRARPGTEVDHQNGDGLDNRKSNLRVTTHAWNMANKPRPKTWAEIASQYRGVCWSKSSKKWVALIQVQGKRIALGTYQTEEEAARAYDAASWKYHGEFGRRNFPNEPRPTGDFESHIQRRGPYRRSPRSKAAGQPDGN